MTGCNPSGESYSKRTLLAQFMRLAFLILLVPLLGACSAVNTVKNTVAGKPTAGTRMKVRTTAYHHSEPGGRVNGIGKTLVAARSAASDWSWMPVGTRFRIVSTGEDYTIEDYGSALVGRKTIDIYKPTRKAMNAWGVRHVDIEIIEWGSYPVSLKILQPRQKYSHVRRMVTELRKKVR